MAAGKILSTVGEEASEVEGEGATKVVVGVGAAAAEGGPYYKGGPSEEGGGGSTSEEGGGATAAGVCE